MHYRNTPEEPWAVVHDRSILAAYDLWLIQFLDIPTSRVMPDIAHAILPRNMKLNSQKCSNRKFLKKWMNSSHSSNMKNNSRKCSNNNQ